MSSRSRPVEKSSSRQTNRSEKSKSAVKSTTGSNNQPVSKKSGKSVPRTSSKADSQSFPKKRTQSAISPKKSEPTVSPKKSKDDSLSLRKKTSLKKVAVRNDPCGGGPDFYTNVLGPTADETILVGLQAFIAFCQDCPDKYEENLLVDSGTGISTKESEASAVAGPSSQLSESTADLTTEKELSVTDAPTTDESEELPAKSVSEEIKSIKDPSVKESSGRSVSIKEDIPSKESKVSSKVSSKEPSLKEPSLKEPSIKEPSIREPSIREPSVKEPSLKEPSVKSISSRGQSSRNMPQKSSTIPEILSSNKSVEEDLEEVDDCGTDEESEDPEDEFQPVATSSQIVPSQKQSSVIQTPNTSSSQESQTVQPSVRHDPSQTGSMVEIGSSQTSQHSISNSESQTNQPCVKSTCSQSKYYKDVTSQIINAPSRSNETQVYDCSRTDKGEQSIERKSEKSQVTMPPTNTYNSSTSSSKLKNSSDSCTCSPCPHSGYTTSSSESPGDKKAICSCSSCKVKSGQKPGVRRSCLKATTKCKCGNSLTAIKSRGSFSATSQKRRVRVSCACDETPSISPSDIGTKESEKSMPSQMGDSNDGVRVRYAITKISKYFSYTTFEVMRSTKKKPKVMPKSLEGVFVLRNTAMKCSSQSVS